MKEISALLLAAGRGERLRPLTDTWPKCLMPINGIPLLEYWLRTLQNEGISDVWVNTHYQADIVHEFIERPRFRNWVKQIYEPELQGTAGTLVSNYQIFKKKTVLVIHADNWIQCNFSDFVQYHQHRRPTHCVITMMTFRADKPSECGIVRVDQEGVVRSFFEKVGDPPGNLANGAIYIVEPPVLDSVVEVGNVKDFSLEVVPRFLGKIATWENKEIHRDIGSIDALRRAQLDLPSITTPWPDKDDWQRLFDKNPIQKIVGQADGIIQ